MTLVVAEPLLLAHLEAGTLTIVRSPVDLLRLIPEAVSHAHTELAHTSFTLTPHLKVSSLPIADGEACGSRACVVVGDARLRRVVLDQLIENALKFTSPGEDIEIAVHPVTQAKDSATKSEPMQIVEVIIQNTGISIPPEHLERIFEHFHQADSSLTREVGGLGLGLAICKRIVVLHGGVLLASSDEHGSTFTVRLPAPRETL